MKQKREWDYYVNDQDGEIIRVKNLGFDVWCVEEKLWKELPTDNEYLRAFMIGQGKWWVSEITEEEAYEKIKNS